MTDNSSNPWMLGYFCGKCGFWIAPGAIHICEQQPKYTHPSTGWQCPICKTVWAPWVDKCTCCIGVTVSSASSTTVKSSQGY